MFISISSICRTNHWTLDLLTQTWRNHNQRQHLFVLPQELASWLCHVVTGVKKNRKLYLFCTVKAGVQWSLRISRLNCPQLSMLQSTTFVMKVTCIEQETEYMKNMLPFCIVRAGDQQDPRISTLMCPSLLMLQCTIFVTNLTCLENN